MIKKDQITFKQLPPPTLTKFLSINHPQKQLIFEHWRNIISCMQIQVKQNQRSTYLIYKSKYYISFANFFQGCLLYQKKFKIMYAQSQQITCVKLHTVTIKSNQIKKKEILVCIGFFDGSIEVYNLLVTDKTVALKKLFFLNNTEIKSPVISLVFHKKSLYVSRNHYVYLYKDLLGTIASIIIFDQINKGKPKGKDEYKFMLINLPLNQISKGTTISLSPGSNCIYCYNQSQGSISFHHETNKECGSIIDSITIIKQTIDQNIVIGDSNDKLKIIYKNKNYIERYFGFKNFCSSIDHLVFPNYEEIWIGDYNGCITYMQRYIAEDKEPPLKAIKMTEVKVKYSIKACQNGIKQLRVCGKLLIILDTEANIHLYDIFRKDILQHQKTVQVQSVEEYSSDV